MARGRVGARYYDGRELLLNGRFLGLQAREEAVTEAKRLRALGHWARIVKCSPYNYAVYSLWNENEGRVTHPTGGYAHYGCRCKGCL